MLVFLLKLVAENINEHGDDVCVAILRERHDYLRLLFQVRVQFFVGFIGGSVRELVCKVGVRHHKLFAVVVFIEHEHRQSLEAGELSAASFFVGDVGEKLCDVEVAVAHIAFDFRLPHEGLQTVRARR